MEFNMKSQALKCLTPENLYEQISQFTAGMKVTRDKFELIIPHCTMQDIEWNHMDQMHRVSVHKTYQENVRIACSNNFALSLTKWGKWPFFIAVTDVYVAQGLFYQTLTIAGVLILHSVISMQETAAPDTIKLTHEWFIASHRVFKFLHKPFNTKLHRLNVRLQQEDEELRQVRYFLRRKGYQFKTDKPDYYNSNRLTAHTIYPDLPTETFITLDEVTEKPIIKNIGELEFIVKKNQERYLIWPAACPHEGGPLLKGKFCEKQIVCPWHSLKFSAVELFHAVPQGTRYGFEYTLEENKIFIKQVTSIKISDPTALSEIA